MAGLYGGTMTVGELLEHGDLGLGTLDSIDGELIVLDGKAYQAKGSGDQPEIVEVSPDALIPYAAVVPHQAEVIFRQRFEMTDKELKERIESYYDGENLFRSIKIRGEFSHMHVRMIPKSTPDTKFADVATNIVVTMLRGLLLVSGRLRFSMGSVWQATICTSYQMI
ncbi:hypothetical protein PC0174_12260 [Streptococcus pneumoniae]|nr:hypothetical protein PC0174_12260 [Streptococcus pneumoniae]